MVAEEQNTHCPACGEPVKSHWRLCPACESSLQDLLCPVCRSPLKENWKRCPECETQLICPRCGRRMALPARGCAYCSEEPEAPALTITDPVCGLEMVYVAGGTFRMGDTFGNGAENESPVHEVTVDSFYLARYTVTQAQWSKLMPDNLSPVKGDRLPVVQVTWEKAGQFARLLTQAHEQRYIFSLPSEAEWEYAARSGGRPELYAGGSDIEALAWYEENSNGRLQPVGTRAPNGLGIHDMSGNVWEWCRDDYLENAYFGQQTDVAVKTDDGSDKVIRGGSWHLDAWSARCTRRMGFNSDFTGPALGFRLIMRPGAK